jgi:hypothetical protein
MSDGAGGVSRPPDTDGLAEAIAIRLSSSGFRIRGGTRPVEQASGQSNWKLRTAFRALSYEGGSYLFWAWQ